MNRYVRLRLVVSIGLVGSYFLLPKYGFTAFNGPFAAHLLYPFSHANIFHLLANILCLWLLRCQLHLPITYATAVLCSFLPSFSFYDIADTITTATAAGQEPTCGFSGVLFAMVGISWGKIRRFKEMIRRNMWFLVLPAFIPHVNALIHLYCILAGYLCGSVCCDIIAAQKKKPCDRK